MKIILKSLFSDLDKTDKVRIFGYYVDGGDLYLYGYLYNDEVPVAVYWKNGEEVLPEIPELNVTYNGSMVVGLCIKDGNVHMAVEYYNYSNDYHYDIVHDGKKISMDAGLAKANSWKIRGSFLSGK